VVGAAMSPDTKRILYGLIGYGVIVGLIYVVIFPWH
jgi:hypothetical protein